MANTLKAAAATGIVAHMLMRASILLTWLIFSALPLRAEDVLVFAAASLKEPLDRLVATQEGVVVSYGGSGTLARQVLSGAPADVIVLAHPIWMEQLTQAGLVSQTANIASNALVLIAPAPAKELPLTPVALADTLGDGRLAMGLTRSVPAGIYGAQALGSLGLWSAVQDKLAEVDNVRAALALVARGEVPLGLVYATDARVSDAVTVVAQFPSGSHAPIIYPAGMITDRGAAFYALLQSEDAQDVFLNAGFAPAIETQ